MLDHASGFLGRQVKAILPQVAVFQAAVFAEFFAVGQQGELAGVTAGEALPGIQDTVVHALDHGAEVQCITEQSGAAALGGCGIDAQQGMAEHGGRAVQVGIGEHQHRGVRVDIGIPGSELRALHCRQGVQRQLLLQPAGA